MLFTKEQEDILKRVYRQKRMSKQLYDIIMRTTIDNLDYILNKVGYRLKLEFKKRKIKEKDNVKDT